MSSPEENKNSISKAKSNGEKEDTNIPIPETNTQSKTSQ